MKPPAASNVCLRFILNLVLYFLAGKVVAGAAVPTLTNESGAYYDWTVTRQPERPYLHRYDQTLVMKIFLAAKAPGDKSQVLLRCDQALDVIRRVDNLTCEVPKIIYLVGWQYNGHDSKYPAWGEVNAGIKRPQDASALDSLKWLMAQATNYHTTVSLHINMIDAYEDSPLWAEYLKKDVIAKDTNGVPIKVGKWAAAATNDLSLRCYNISYARECELGLAQKRIDSLLAMLPIQRAGTIHIDAFHTIPAFLMRSEERISSNDCISPFLGYTLVKEAEAQRKILRYFRDRGVDPTAEMSIQFRFDPFIGLQPMAHHYFMFNSSNVPPSLYCGTAMTTAERGIRNDPGQLRFMKQLFCTQFLPWYYANNTNAVKGSQKMIDSPKGQTIGGERLETGDDVCIPALWRDHALVAYSRKGYAGKTWELPPGWEKVKQVKISELTIDGPKPLTETGITNHLLALSPEADQALLIVPANEQR